MSQSTQLSVSELTQSIKQILETGFSSLAVKGEVTNLRRQSSGHVYFSLKDEHSQISAVLFSRYKTKESQKLADGDQVVVHGSLGVYGARGVYQIIANSVTKVGLGDLLLELQRRKEKLQQMGWFAPEHKQALPEYPLRIGVVTSPTGSVIQDIIHVLSRRCRDFTLILNPVSVQGPQAAQEIAVAIEEFNEYGLADVLIVGRGGGSLEDLWCFNEFCVVKAIFQSKIPIITAIGHETDTMLADFVSDVRAPTPSSAAEIVMQKTEELQVGLQNLYRQIDLLMLSRIREWKSKLSLLAQNPLFESPYAILNPHIQRLDDLQLRVSETFNWPQIIEQKRLLLDRLSNHLKDLNPKNILKKGYCIPLSEKTDSVIMSTKDISQNEPLSLVFHDGKAQADVKQVISNSEAPS